VLPRLQSDATGGDFGVLVDTRPLDEDPNLDSKDLWPFMAAAENKVRDSSTLNCGSTFGAKTMGGGEWLCRRARFTSASNDDSKVENGSDAGRFRRLSESFRSKRDEEVDDEDGGGEGADGWRLVVEKAAKLFSKVGVRNLVTSLGAILN